MSRGQNYTPEQREAQRARVRLHYENNKQYYIDKAKKAGHANRQWVRDYKESLPCTDCGKFFPYYVTQFDHVRGVKLFNIGNTSRGSLTQIKTEIEKCELVCGNCHAERTHQRRIAAE